MTGMTTRTCPGCGETMPADRDRCPSCDRPAAGDAPDAPATGEPRNAPAGSDARSRAPETPTGWNALFWVGLAVAAVVAMLVGLLG